MSTRGSPQDWIACHRSHSLSGADTHDGDDVGVTGDDVGVTGDEVYLVWCIFCHNGSKWEFFFKLLNQWDI